MHNKSKFFILLSFFCLLCIEMVKPVGSDAYITAQQQKGYFQLASETNILPLCVSSSDYPGVLKVAEQLRADLESVTGKMPALHKDIFTSVNAIVVGTYDKNPLIQKLIQEHKIDKSLLEGKREKFIIQVVNNAFLQGGNLLVIAGSDKRGTIYGMYDLATKAGVSPWYYWADVPVKKSETLYVKPGIHTDGEPVVEYRGIFINDEAPALSGWVAENFGGFNHQFYEKVFELILRLKGNFLWPAMWGRAFYDDDPENGFLADEYGIIIGTSHHEPMGRAHDEWRRYGKGKWNYDANADTLREFWKCGMQRMKDYETVVTLGMRGDGDEPMSEESNIALLEKIVTDQRNIIQDVTGKLVEQTPQVWALYKEVQDYYDRGMRVPDDITLLLCDDNWGNVRKLPDLNAPVRKGGYGMYYHYDYVGGPRNYKWLNTNPIPRIWEQMNLCYNYGVKKLWIVNVGDIKPMEYPIEFFLDMAWNPEKFTPENLSEHTYRWAEQQFGNKYASEIARFLSLYAKYNARRKPELLSPETYSLRHYHEADRIVNEYNELAKEAQEVYDKLLPEYKDAYYQLVLFPILACSNLNELYVSAGKNRLYATYGLKETNDMADKVERLFERDSLLTYQYNKIMSGGKWNHFMDQTHIGYTYWQEPPVNKMPEVIRLSAEQINQNADIQSIESVSEKQNQPIDLNSLPEKTFVEHDGYISIEAEHYSKVVNTKDISWKIIPDLGRTLSAVTTFPVTKGIEQPSAVSPRLEYNIYVNQPGEIEVTLYLSPTLNFNNNAGLKYALAINDEMPQVINFNGNYTNKEWEQWVADNVIKVTTKFNVNSSGLQTIKYYLVDPAVVLQKIVINTGGLQPSYLGPPSFPVRSL